MKEKNTTPLEKDIQRTICEWLALNNYFFWRNNNVPIFGKNNAGRWTHRAMPKYTPKGLPDIIVIHNKKFISLEIKRDNTCKLSPEQVDFGLKVIKNGGVYYKIVSLEELKTKKEFYL
jgi:hypothetical protein